MRYLFGFLCVCALGLMPLVGCETTGEGGTGGSAGSGGTGGNGGDGGSAGTGGGGAGGDGGHGGGVVACTDNVCPCSEAGIRAAIAEGGGPFTFDCGGPQTVGTEAEIVIDNDVILDGERNLTVDGNQYHRVFLVAEDVAAELRGVTVTRGNMFHGGGIHNAGTLTLTNSTVSDNYGGGIETAGTLTMTNSTVSDNWRGGGIVNSGTLTLTNSLIEGDCYSQEDGVTTSNGYNIESPGDTCGFDQVTDQAEKTPEELNLGPLADNDGPTLTHKPGDGGFDTGSSAAIDKIPEADCQVTEDQRGEPRPVAILGPEPKCDVGSVEVQPEL